MKDAGTEGYWDDGSGGYATLTKEAEEAIKSSHQLQRKAERQIQFKRKAGEWNSLIDAGRQKKEKKVKSESSEDVYVNHFQRAQERTQGRR